MTRPTYHAVGILALVAFGAIVGSQIEGDFDHVTIASETPPPGMSAAPAPDSPAGSDPAGVESGAEIEQGVAVFRDPGDRRLGDLEPLQPSAPPALNDPIIGDPAYSIVEYATVGETADRLAQQAVGLPPVPPRPTATAGDCASWVPVFEAYGATPDEVAFFVPRILERESGCGRDTLNEATGDSGPCQINPTHSRAGWFGRVEYGAGGWLAALHGLRTGHDTDSADWVGACLTLYRVCGAGAWAPPYSCDNRRLP